MKREIKDKAASVRQKLTNISREKNVEFDSLLLRYFQERFLYRLSISNFSNKMVLKGGLFLICLEIPVLRPTKDMDFLADDIHNDLKEVKNLFETISEIQCDDGVFFDTGSITTQRITEDGDYEGIRLKIEATLGKAKKKLQIDIGFGDVVIPKVKSANYPTIFGEPYPLVNVYSIESVISEKFEAMVKLEILNSRMKDFYDVFTLSKTNFFNGNNLKKAILATFKKRGTGISDKPYVFTNEFKNDDMKHTQWTAFLRKTRLENTEPDFKKIINGIARFLSPVLKSINLDSKMNSNWSASKSKWE